MSNPWDRRPDETRRAYAAFMDFCAIGPGRSVRVLGALYRQQSDHAATTEAAMRKPPTRRLRTIGQWSSAFDWPERAAAWDKHLLSREEQKWAIFLEELREKERAVADALLEKASQMLTFPLAKTTRRDEAGLTIIEPANWRMADAAKVAAEGSRLGRKAAGVADGEEAKVEITVRTVGGGVVEEL